MSVYQCANRSCGKDFEAREADRARGWARFCSKSCKATHQEARTGQHRRYMTHRAYSEQLDAGWDAVEAGWDGHKNVIGRS